MTPKRLQQLRRKLQESRCRLLRQAPRFAAPLRDIRFVALKQAGHMSTNGVCIYFDPDWLQKLTPEALDFMLCHQLMHIGLGHIHRPAFYRGARYHLACDIVANSLLRAGGWEAEQLPGVGVLYHTTFYPQVEGCELTPEEAFTKIPFDPSTLSAGAKRRYLIDSDEFWDRPEDRGEAGELVLSPENPDPEELEAIAYAAAGGCPGRFAERLWPVVRLRTEEEETAEPAGEASGAGEDTEELLSTLDAIHDRANAAARRAEAAAGAVPQLARTESWDAAAKDALKTVRAEKSYSIEKANDLYTTARVWQKTDHICLNWRVLLDTFLQEELCDYSFLPPDRRYQDETFFLPDFSDTVLQPLKILMMVDTSGSISDELLAVVFTEISSAIEQFHGSLTGMLGFFDTQTYRPVPFSSVGDIRRIQPYGGGGTDFGCVFRDCRRYFGDSTLTSIVIVTDGQGTFPEESAAAGIPVLWLLTDKTVQVPWGHCAFLSREKDALL